MGDQMLFGVQWYYWAILLVAIIIAIFAWSKALKAGKERREKMKKEAAIWKRDYELREKFTILTEEKLNSTEETELLHGVAMNIQAMLEKANDMTESFNALPQEKKFVYALEYFDEDAKKNLSVFFKNNGEPLISMVPDALNAIGAGKYVEHYATLLPTERSWNFQIGAELSYQYFLPCTNYRLGFGASYELSYSNYNPQQTIGLFNLNVSWKLFNF